MSNLNDERSGFLESGDNKDNDPFVMKEPARPKQEKPVESVTVMAGKKVRIPPPKSLPQWQPASTQDQNDPLGDGEEFSFSDLESINKELIRCRVRMNRVRRDMRNAGREAIEAKVRYQRAYRRALIQQSGGTVETRKASAELLCEDLEADMVMKQQVAEEYSSLFRASRDDLDNIKTVAFNLRALYQSI